VIFLETIIPADDVRLATGEIGRISKIMVTFSDDGMVIVVINGG
jgi:hypothetical protein